MNKESYLISDRILRINTDIESIENKINICENIILKFNNLPNDIKEGLNKNIKDNDFTASYLNDIKVYKWQLTNLYKTLEELKSQEGAL